MAGQHDVELVNDSLERCMRGQGFFDSFYLRFRDSTEEVAAKFDGTDTIAQSRALRLAFYILLQAVGGDPEAWQHLEMRALRHDRKHLDIRPGLYDLWLECLLETIREFDLRADEATEAAWRRVMQEGIDFMIARY